MNTSIISVNARKIVVALQFALFVAIAYFAPSLGHQYLTGPVVNATLFMSTALLGVNYGLMLGLLPSVIALSTGLLPVVLAPMVPFIMIGNIVMILIFDRLKEKNYWLSVVSASLVKFLFLFSTANVAASLVAREDIALRVIGMMGWMQLATALIGGVLAFGFIRFFKLSNKV